MLDFTATVQTLKDLEQARVIRFSGISGQPTTAEVAVQAPALVKVHSNSGKQLSLSDNGDGTFRLKES